jgi:hypothetical protein
MSAAICGFSRPACRCAHAGYELVRQPDRFAECDPAHLPFGPPHADAFECILIERAKRSVSIDVVGRIAKALAVEPWTLLKHE